MVEHLLTPAAVAAALTRKLNRRVDPALVRWAIKAGHLPCVEILGPTGEVSGYGVKPDDKFLWQPSKRGG